MASSTRISRTQFDNIKKLQGQGLSSHKIGELVGLNQTTALKYMKKESYPDGPADPDVSVIEAEKPSEIITETEEHQLKGEIKVLKKRITDLLDEKVATNALSEFSAQLASNPVTVPKWVSRTRKASTNKAVPMAFMSDWHLDEVVNRAQMGGVNEFNREIAESRCGNFFDNTTHLAKKYIGGVEYDGMYLLMGGDMFSGNIHEELKITNETTLIESVLFWVEPIASGIRFLADEFGSVHVPCVVGNHGRTTHKPAMKNRVVDNFDYLFYNMLAMSLQDDGRITWDIPTSADCVFSVYDHTFLLTHGDQFRGGSGIAGPVTPWALGDHKKRKRQQAVGSPYDTLVFGHWHQLTLGMNGMIVNGSLKGYDEFASICNFPFEPPQQAFWLVQPGVGVTGRWPIHVLGDKENYGSGLAAGR